MTCRTLQFVLSAAALLIASGCMNTDASAPEFDSEVRAQVEPTRIALRAGTAVDADEIDGFCEDGAGVYLSTSGNTAELLVYVVTPAESVTFERPTLHVTSQQGEEELTEESEFESVTLRAGESFVFSEEVEGTLLDVVAEISAQ